jgi:hypothetical protein
LLTNVAKQINTRHFGAGLVLPGERLRLFDALILYKGEKSVDCRTIT